MKDAHRELPKKFLENKAILTPKDFISMIKSNYSKKRDLKINFYRRKEIIQFQNRYLKIMNHVADEFHSGNLNKTFLEVIMRSSVVNQQHRITGDSIIPVATSLIRNQKSLNFKERQQIIESLSQHQIEQVKPEINQSTKVGRITLRNIKAIEYCSNGF